MIVKYVVLGAVFYTSKVIMLSILNGAPVPTLPDMTAWEVGVILILCLGGRK